MDNARWKTVKKLLDESLEQPRSNVEGFLKSACGHDRHLMDEVLSLLDHRGVDQELFEGGAAAALGREGEIGAGEDARDPRNPKQ